MADEVKGKLSVEERLAAVIEKLSANAAEDRERLTKALEQIAQNTEGGPIKQIPVGRAKFRTPWNPSGEKRSVKLARVVWQSGRRVKEALCNDEEIKLLNAVQPGVYNNRKWTVVQKQGGDNEPEIHIFWPNKTQEERISFATETQGGGLMAAVKMMIAEKAKQATIVTA